MEEITFICGDEDDGVRIDKILPHHLERVSRNYAQSLIDSKNVVVNGEVVPKNRKVSKGDYVTVNRYEPKELNVVGENIPLEIVYEDDSVLVVNKPKGMVVHPAPGHLSGTLVNALMYHCKDRLSTINGVIRPGIVHRIDKNTSGLLMVAKTNEAHIFLSDQIREHSFTRVYEAIAVGKFKDLSGTIDAPIGRDENNRLKMTVIEKNSKNAITHYKVLGYNSKYTYVECKLETGRTHQIRVHMSYIGHPLLGDDVYGKAVKGLEGQCLYAKKLGFIHPVTKKYMEFTCDMPEYFKKIVNTMELIQ